jgi:hypothetical protein
LARRRQQQGACHSHGEPEGSSHCCVSLIGCSLLLCTSEPL